MAPSLEQDQNGRDNDWRKVTEAYRDLNKNGSASAPAVKTPFPTASATAPPPAKRLRASASGSDDESPFPEWTWRTPGRLAGTAPGAPAVTPGSGVRAQTANRTASFATPNRGVPQGFKVTVEDEREVLVLDDDDDDDGETGIHGTARLDGLPSLTTFASRGPTPRDVATREPHLPVQPVQPVHPARPVQPVQPIQRVQQAAQHVQPTQPVQTVQPVQPVRPAQTGQPIRPVQTVSPFPPVGPLQPTQPVWPVNTVLASQPNPSLPRGPVSEGSSREQTPRPKADSTSASPTALRSVPALVRSSDVRTRQQKRHPDGPLTACRKPAALSFARFTTLPRRPYLQIQHRDYVAQNEKALLKKYVPSSHGGPAVIHVDFTPEEIRAVLKTARAMFAGASPPQHKAKPSKKPSPPDRELKRLVHGDAEAISSLSRKCSIKGRQAADIAAFLADVCSLRGRLAMRLTAPRALTLQREDRAAHAAAEVAAARSSQFSSLLLAREVAGTLAPGRTRQLVNFPNAFRTLREDSLALCNEWTNCAGDVTTLTWTSEETFVCGTTTHMDNRNHQYNRQGNLAFGSVTQKTLRAYAEHRVARTGAIAAAGTAAASAEHSSRYDDPWLYTSVVSSEFVAHRQLVFTSGFDNTVKLWRVNEADNSMALLSTWNHKGKVNFVVASPDEPCLVATASDVSADAVRIYRLPPLEAAGRVRVTYKSLSCSRITDLEGRPVLPDKWAYFPAAVRWGLAPGTRHLLLVGYSPRGLSDNSDDEHIPDDRRNSGELCLWDGQTGQRWHILSGTSQNVFEVAWHPTQQCFAAATSPVGTIESNVRTQIRIFRPSDNPAYAGRAFSEVQVLDCFADDINELALLPNSFSYIYAAAGCTNGRTYVWDTSQGDKPIHILAHGPCVEELSGERISTEDTGVKFVAWGATPDRLYTGSSDGVVKVWNIRSRGLPPLVRNLLECPASVSFGAFSPSKSRLAVGDASGRVFVLAVEDSRIEKDPEEDAFLSETEDDGEENDAAAAASRRQKTFRHHPPRIIRHATPPPPPPPPTVLPPGPGLSTPTGVKMEVPSPNGSVDARSSAASLHAAAVAAAAAVTGSSRPNVDPDSGAARAHAFLTSGQLVLAPCRTVGAVKGPNYADTNLFCRPFHMNGQPENPLLASHERVQQENRPLASSFGSHQKPLKDVMLADGMLLDGDSSMDLKEDEEDTDDSSSSGDDDGLFVSQDIVDKRALKVLRRRTRQHTLAQHRRNVARDLDVDALTPETRQELELADRAALLHIDDGIDYGLAFEDDDVDEAPENP